MILRSPHGRTLDLSSRPAIVGVINCTPDSFHRASRARSPCAALLRAETMLSAGADIIEVGGESTGPGSKDVRESIERKRILPVITLLRTRYPDAWIAVDTWKASVAAAAIECGADIINDITAGRGDHGMFPLLKKTGAPCVLMYTKDPTPRTMVKERHYHNVTATVRRFLAQRIQIALRAGMLRSQIIIDPGLGHFVSSDPQYSFTLLRDLPSLCALAPVLVSPSRKSFLSEGGTLPPKERLPGTIAASLLSVLHGASLIRTHDVAAIRQALDIVSAVNAHTPRSKTMR